MNVYIFLHQTIIMFLLLDCIFCNKHGAKRQRAQFMSKDNEGYRPRHKISKTSGDEEFVDRHTRSSFDSKKQCAVMYKNKEPIGLLEPFEDSYRLLPVSGEKIPVDITPIQDKRRNLMDLLYPSKFSEDVDDMSELQREKDSISTFSDEKYPYIFAKFKIGNKLDRDFGHKRAMHKRSPSLINDNNVNALKATLAKMNTENSESVDRELRSILNTMGLIEDEETQKEQEKRSIEEDENMELGSNKINMAKEQPVTEKRYKRDDSTVSTENKHKRDENDTTVLPSPLNEESTIQTVDLLEGGNSNENEEENIDKSEEKSREKRETGIKDLSTTQPVGMNDESDLTDYEKRVVRDIRQKIAKLKEEVKKEIEEIKTGGDSHIDDIKIEEPQRKKRETMNTLLDAENAAIDPLFNAEEELKPHIRRRRSFETLVEENMNNLEPVLHTNASFMGRKLMHVQEEKKSQISKRYKRHWIKQKADKDKFSDRKGRMQGKRYINTKVPKEKANREEANNAHKKYHSHTMLTKNNRDKKEVNRAQVHANNSEISNAKRLKDEKLLKHMSKKRREISHVSNHKVKRELNINDKNVTNSVFKRESSKILAAKRSIRKKPHEKGNSYTSDHKVKRELSTNDENVTNSVFKREVYLTKHKIHKRDLQNDYKWGNSDTDDQFYIASGQLGDPTTTNNKCLEPEKDHFCNNNSCEKCNVNLALQKPAVAKKTRHKRSVNDEVLSKQTTESNDGLLQIVSTQRSKLEAPQEEHNLYKRDTQEEYEDDDQETDDDNSRMSRSSDSNKDEVDNDSEGFEKKHPCNCQKNSNGCKCGTSEGDSDKASVDDNNESAAAFDDSEYDTKVSKRETGDSQFENGEYYVDLHPDVYQISPSRQATRRKRQSFDDLIALHGGGATRNHLVAIRQRSMVPDKSHSRFRRRTVKGEIEQPQQLTDMSDEDLFGALPQGFEGELARYKRVKRRQ